MPRPTKSGIDRRPRGFLNTDLRLLCNKVVTGELAAVNEDGEPYRKITPAIARKLLTEFDGLDKEDLPSTGAIAAVFKKWERIGYAVCDEAPYGFVDFTDEGRRLGFDELEKRWKQREAEEV